jgi:ribonuclease Z
MINLHDKLFLMDCGEGTQVQLRKHKFKFQRISQMFVSHMHGDHYLGLPGLLSSMHLLGRTKPLQLFGPAGLKEIIDLNLKLSETFLNYEIEHIAIDYSGPKVIFEDRTLEISTIMLKHRIDCAGFLFREKPKRHRIKKFMAEADGLTIPEIVTLKNGENVVREDGTELTLEKYTLPPHTQRAYAYCSDTAYTPKVIEQVKGVDLLYHESTFLEDMKDRAKSTYHSTAKQAAQVAQEAGVDKLLLGHFSSRYTDESKFTAEAREIFENVHIAKEGKTFEIEQKVVQAASE